MLPRSGLAAALLAALGLAACKPSVPPPAVAAAPVAAPAIPPGGSGCGPAIARTQTIVNSDVATGNLNEPVGKRFSADLGRAAEACAAGHEAEALRLHAAARARYGYP
ncbi:conserved hypothetical protein [Methylobacterium sp. 4-46]|uniref:hypothetical protein n=1 Tax=unclassified Methylobacterium TaxID=2615210 RepID=UPI000152E52B|nr:MULTISPECIES: hypothetical protein [Methylobacterium]ACA15959.1 conserved hypothetical protein [Methylobacterium sp. 4-46]WFT81675.1 hypothetical protein QA634_07320 [Methylobacterium nodulans]